MTKKEITQYVKNAKLIPDKDQIILDNCLDKQVLDVGCIGQDRDYDSPDWLHTKIRAIAVRVDGVDILEDRITEARKKGFSIYQPTELNVNTKYDIVIMADVIEHVNDPVAFLSFYSTFLKTDGKILVTTPNSNRSNNFINILFNNNYSVNPEHTFWFCPKTFAEVVERSGLQIFNFFWISHYFRLEDVKGLYQKMKLFISIVLFKWRRNFSPNMIFFLSKNTA